MPLCDHIKKDGTPCKRKVRECWQHQGSGAFVRRLAVWATVLATVFTLGQGMEWLSGRVATGIASCNRAAPEPVMGLTAKVQ